MNTLEKILIKFSENVDCSLYGRVTAIRNHGNIIFFDIKDNDQKIQLIAEKDTLGVTPNLGDIVEVEGITLYSNRGEKSIKLQKLEIIAKNLEGVFRSASQSPSFRHVELMESVNYKLFIRKRFQLATSIREFLSQRDFIEFDTGTLQHYSHSGFSRPFSTRMNAKKKDIYLKGTSEIRLKQLIVGGFNKVFELGKVFRNEGQDRTHHPEYTQLEVYQAYTTYWEAMTLLEQMIKSVAKSVFPQNTILGSEEWPRTSLLEIGTDVIGRQFSLEMSREEMLRICSKHLDGNRDISASTSNPQLFLYIIRKILLPTIQGPSFIYDFPEMTSPLTKKSTRVEHACEKSALVIQGRRVSDIASEETDYDLLNQKLLTQESLTQKKPDPSFLHAMRCGMPPTSGYSLGIERLSLFLQYGDHERPVKDAILFPL